MSLRLLLPPVGTRLDSHPGQAVLPRLTRAQSRWEPGRLHRDVNFMHAAHGSRGAWGWHGRSSVLTPHAAPTEGDPQLERKERIWTLPTALTLARVAAIPAFVALWYSPAPWAPAAATWLLLAASVTDFLDGYLARKLNVASEFGAFLDPVADKLMVSTALVLLSTAPIVAGHLAGDALLCPLAAAAIVGREIAMSALREWAAGAGPAARGAVVVSAAGKLKTSVQLAALVALCAARTRAAPATLADAGAALLALAAFLTLWSLAQYFAALWPYMAGRRSCR
ncbi:PGP3 [Auxenochlorella protothecoides x Auxenochlorella symbiontica]